MVGGKVINVVQLTDCTWIQCKERVNYYGDNGRRTGKFSETTCAIRIEKNAEVKVGDALWWQGSYAMWTPKPDDGREDVRLKRLGYSHSSIPDDVMFKVAQ